MARLLVLDVGKCNVYEKECNELKDFYDAIGYDCFDIAHLNIGGKYFDCFVDDEGLFRNILLPSAVNIDEEDGTQEVLLVGNIVFANHDSQGETTSLSDEEIRMIKENIIVGLYGNIPIISVLASY